MFKRYPDGCYAFVLVKMRGPCAHSKVEAYARYLKSGLIRPASSGS